MVTNGVFTPSDLAAALVRSDAMWADNMLRADYQAQVGVLNAIRSEQTARLQMLERADKDIVARVTWLGGLCDEKAENCDDQCDFAGPQLGTDAKDMEISRCKDFVFSVNLHGFMRNDYTAAEAVAAGFLKADKVISEAMAQDALSIIEANLGVNTVSDGVGTVNGTDTAIDSVNWTARLFAYLQRVAMMNNFSNPFLLSGSNLFEEYLLTTAARQDANGGRDANLFQLIRTYFDMKNIDMLNAPDLKTYLINRGALAFASKARYAQQPTDYGVQQRYSIPSRNLNGVRFDVYTRVECKNDDMIQHFKVIGRYDIFTNPTGCTETNTGILGFTNVP